MSINDEKGIHHRGIEGVRIYHIIFRAICIYEFDKNYSLVNVMSFSMKSHKGEHKVIQLSNAGDSLISIVSLLGN